MTVGRARTPAAFPDHITHACCDQGQRCAAVAIGALMRNSAPKASVMCECHLLIASRLRATLCAKSDFGFSHSSLPVPDSLQLLLLYMHCMGCCIHECNVKDIFTYAHCPVVQPAQCILKLVNDQEQGHSKTRRHDAKWNQKHSYL
jgi:hypothetical protein